MSKENSNESGKDAEVLELTKVMDASQDILESLVLQSNHVAHEAEAKLQVEEKGNSVAWLQGFCAGIRAYKVAANDTGFDLPPKLSDTANRMTPWVQGSESASGDEDDDGDTFCDIGLDELRIYDYQIEALLRDSRYVDLLEAMQKSIAGKKEYLYVSAKTSRDLFWTHGWHKGFTWVDWQIKKVGEWRKYKENQKKSELPFGD